MISRFCNPIFKQKTNNAVLTFQSARYLFLNVAKNARGGFRSSFSDQFAFRSRTAAPTLRERLLGPTTGKPFIYGTYALGGASVFGIGMLCYYGLTSSKGMSIADRSVVWPVYVRQRLQKTYGYLAGGLALTAAAGYYGSRSQIVMQLAGKGTLPALLVSMAVIIGSQMVAHAIPYENTLLKHSAWALHCAVMGAFLAPLCVIGGPTLFRAAWYTAGIVAGLSTTAICAPSEKFLYMGGPLAMGFGLMFVSSLGTFFFPPHTALGAGLASFVVYGGLILFSAFLLYNTQKVVRYAETAPYQNLQRNIPVEFGFETQPSPYRAFDPINAQMGIYADILNIFIRLAMIMGGNNNRRK